MSQSATPGPCRTDSPTSYEIVSRIWPSSGIEENSISDELYKTFLHYVEEECNHRRHHSSKSAIQTLDSTLSILDDFRNTRNKTRRELLSSISRKFINIEDQTILDQMDIAARLLLTFHIRSSSSSLGPIDIGVDSIGWLNDQTLEDLVHSRINRSCGPATRHRHREFDEDFTATFLSSTCGIRLHWTNNLADHLKLNRKRRSISVYQHKVCLLHHLDSSEEPILPRPLLSETLDTFELLFPWHNKDTRSFLLENNKPIYGLGRCGRKRIPNIEHYVFWGHRLSDLLDVFEDPPRNVWQLWRDQRNFNEWAAFWLALLVIVLTVVSIVAGMVSTVYSIKQYNLALAQACVAEDAAKQLPGFCH